MTHLSQRFLIFIFCIFIAGLSTVGSGANAAVLIAIDKAAQRMSVSVDGATRWTWPVSTGREGHATPSGSFQLFRMEATHFSKEWDDAPMPHSIFFTKVGHAIHGTFDAAHLGTAASHGCVRLSAANATQLFQLVKTEGMPNTKVVITGEQPYGEPEAYNQNSSGQNQGFWGQNSSGNSWGNSWGENTNNQNWFGQNSDGQGSASQRPNGKRGTRPMDQRDGWSYESR